MGAVAVRISRPAAGVLAPLLLRQGEQVRRSTPLLPEAGGPRSGTDGTGPDLHLTVLGESPAAGVGVATQDQGLARQLALALASDPGATVHWRVVARTGATAGATLRELAPEAVRQASDVVVVVLGVNDTLKLQPVRRWRRTVAELLDTLRPGLRPNGVVLLAAVPPLGSFPSLPQPLRAVMGLHARALDHALRGLARRSPGVLHAASPSLSGPEMFAEDRFHPSAAAYHRWAAALAVTARTQLGG